MTDAIPYGYCHCGCGKQTTAATIARSGYAKGEPHLFIIGHIGKLNSIKKYESQFSVSETGETLKSCSICKESKPTAAFSRRKKNDQRLRSLCNACHRKDLVARYLNNPEPQRQKSRERDKTEVRERVRLIETIRSESGCVVCGEMESCVLDFHHLVGNSKGREGGIPVARAAGKSWKALYQELAKCIVVCANCHRKIHAGMIVLEAGAKPAYEHKDRRRVEHAPERRGHETHGATG
jgi:hypothetical protein